MIIRILVQSGIFFFSQRSTAVQILGTPANINYTVNIVLGYTALGGNQLNRTPIDIGLITPGITGADCNIPLFVFDFYKTMAVVDISKYCHIGN